MKKAKITLSLNDEELAQLEAYRIHVATKENRIVTKQQVLKIAIEPYLSIGAALKIQKNNGVSDAN